MFCNWNYEKYECEYDKYFLLYSLQYFLRVLFFKVQTETLKCYIKHYYLFSISYIKYSFRNYLQSLSVCKYSTCVLRLIQSSLCSEIAPVYDTLIGLLMTGSPELWPRLWLGTPRDKLTWTGIIRNDKDVIFRNNELGNTLLLIRKRNLYENFYCCRVAFWIKTIFFGFETRLVVKF